MILEWWQVIILLIICLLVASPWLREKAWTKVFEVCPNCNQRGSVESKREFVKTIPAKFFRPAKKVFKVWKWCAACGHKYNEGYREEEVDGIGP